MKPKRHFRNPLIFSRSIHYHSGWSVPLQAVAGASRPAFALSFAAILISFSDAAIFGGAPGASPANPQPGSAPIGGTTPNASDATRANARETMLRTSQAVGAMKALQDAARAAAAASNIPGQNSNNPSQPLPNVPNGLAPGGLQPLAGGTWLGAKPAESSTINGLTGVTIKQTAQQALLDWQTFNVGKNTTLTFDQSAGGGNASQWIAFNKVTDPTANPTQILGRIKAQGQVYIINPNGIIFGGTSQVNVHTLTASTLPINDNLVARGLLNNPDAQFLFNGLGASNKIGDITVQAGAKIDTPVSADGNGGRIALIGANVRNSGTLSSPAGQTILAAGLQVGFAAHASTDPSLRGLDVYVGAVTDPASILEPYAGTVTNDGIIEIARASAVLTGKSVNQNGVIDGSTSVSLNGRIDLLANYGAISNPGAITLGASPFYFTNNGTVTLGEGSTTRILPELNSDETSIGTKLALRSKIDLTGKAIHFQEGSILQAPNAEVDVSAGSWTVIEGTPPSSVLAQSAGQIYLEKDVLINVSGSIAENVPVSQNIVTVQLRGAELANSPLQRTGILRNETVSVDIRDAGIYQQGMWIGTPLADLSGFANLIQKTVGELTVAGGTVNFSAGSSVVMQAGSEIDVSGGAIIYQPGKIETTQLLSNGRVVDIRDARPDETYDGILGRQTVTDPKWGVTEDFANPLSPSGGRFEASSTHGGSGGSLAITAPSMALDGQFRGNVVTGERQREAPPFASSLKLSFLAQDPAYPSLPIHARIPPDIIFQAGASQLAADPFTLNSNSNPLGLRNDRLETVILSPDLINKSGFGTFTFDNNDGNITVPTGVDLVAPVGASLAFKGSNITIDGSITAAAGSLSFSTYNLPLDTLNLLRTVPPGAPPAAIAGRGLFTLGETASLSTAGMLVNDLRAAEIISPITIKGGSIKIEGYSAKLAEGGIIDVSGGVALSSRGTIRYGDAGKVSVTAGRDLSFTSTLGGTLELGSSFRGFSGAKAGSLSLTAPAFQIGGSSSAADVTLLQAEFFNSGGFGTFSLTGIGVANGGPENYTPGVLIKSGTQIRPTVQSRFANLGADGRLELSTSLQEEGLRTPASLSFNSAGATFDLTILVRGDTLMEQGASIVTDALGSVSFQGQTVTIAGQISAAGGNIGVTGNNAFPTVAEVPPSALPTVILASTASLSAAGKVVLTDNPFGLRQGSVLAGGTINIAGNIFAENGALLNVSGSSGILDLDPAYLSLNPKNSGALPSGRTTPVTIDSDGGRISLTGSEMLFTNATLKGHAGGASANGGSLAVSSGKFHLAATSFNNAEANLIVTQQSTAFTGGGVGEVVRDVSGNSASQLGHFGIDRYASGGFNSLTLGGNLRFEGAVNIAAPGSLKVATGGVIYADGHVEIAARHVALGREFRPPSQTAEISPFIETPAIGSAQLPFLFSPTRGSGTLTVKAELIDFGILSFQGIDNASLLAANGDIRGNGTFNIAGDLTLEAGQIYATTAGLFNIFAYDSGSVTIKGGKARPLPLSAGGTLSIYASTIDHGGTLRAPLGTINLGWDGSGVSPINLMAGNTSPSPVTANLTLRSGSVSSVSAIDLLTGKSIAIPYGISLDGKTWIDPAGNDITTTGPPAKGINLAAATMTSESGSLIDIRGGGDLYAYRWISGNGGTRDILANPNAFAIIPGYGLDYAPYAPFNSDTSATKLAGEPGYVNGSLQAGDKVTLAAGSGLAAGTYTLLPARYALLPGAFLVTPQTGTPPGSVGRPDGSSIVSGFRSNDLNLSRTGPTRIAPFEIASAAIVRQRSQYQDLSANSFLRSAAISRELSVPRLPIDAGHLSFTASTAMSLNGNVNSLAPLTGRGSVIDINSPVDILINQTGTGGSAGNLVLSASLLNSFGAESLLIGGTRQSGTITVGTGNLTLDNAGSPLIGSDIILAAKNNLILAEGSAIFGNGNDKLPDRLRLGDASIPGSGNGTLVRVSGNSNAEVVRQGVTVPNSANLVVGAGARLSGGSIILDSTFATNLSSGALLEAASISLSSGQISILLGQPGAIAANPGLILSGQALASLQQSAKRLTLLSYSTLDIYGNGQVGSRAFEQLSLQARGIRGFNLAGGSAVFSAKNLIIENPAGGDPLLLPGGPLDGTLTFDADQITLGTNQVNIGDFANVTLTADKRVLTSGTGAFSTAGNLTIHSALLTGERASDYQFSSQGKITIDRLTGQSAGTIGGLGGKLALSGASVEVNSNIRLPSGSISLTATQGDVLIGNRSTALLDAAGTSMAFNEVTRHTSGGTVSFTANAGLVRIAAAGTVDVSGADAGQIRIGAANGGFDLSGNLKGSAGSLGEEGKFSLDVGSLASGNLTALDSILNAGSFTASRFYRIRNGNIVIGGLATAHDYRVSADQGSITVIGKIDGSGETGGNIQLSATGSLTLASGAQLSVAGEHFTSSGKGGTITLEAGAQHNGISYSSALLDLQSGSAIDLSVAASSANDARFGKFTGKLHLRAPRTAGNNEIQIGTIGSSVTGASSIVVEGYKLYSLTGTGVITAALQNQIKTEAVNFLGSSGSSSAAYSGMLGRLTAQQPALDLILAPGAEIFSSGDLTLGSTTSTSTGDWNLETFRFGPKAAAGVLTLRAAGDLVFYNALSDGFAAVTPNAANGQSALWLAPLMAQNLALPANTQTWSYRLTSGADISSASFESVLPLDQTATGSLLLGKNYGTLASSGSGANVQTSAAIANRFQVIRTGSGDIDINAARDVLLLNQFATIYTSGTRVTDSNTLFTAGDFITPILFNPGTGGTPPPAPAFTGRQNHNYFVQYSMAGGDVSIHAVQDIARMTRNVTTSTGGILIADSSRQLPNNWLYRRGYVDENGDFGVGGVIVSDTSASNITDPSASTTWWVDFSNFFEGIGALGGGDVTLVAGRDVRNIDAVAPTNARMASGKPDSANMLELGGGNVTVTAGRDIDAGVYYVERGQGILQAGRDITTNSTRSPSLGIITSLTNPSALDSHAWLPTTLFLGKGGFDIEAGGDLLLGPVANPFLLPQGTGNKFWYKTYFSTYAAESYVNATSLGGSLTHRTEVSLGSSTESMPALAAWLGTQQLPLTNSGASGYQPWLRLAETVLEPFNIVFSLMPPTLKSTAFSGNINLAGDLTLFPSASGQLELLTSDSIIGLQNTGFSSATGSQIFTASTINLSDADPSSIPGIASPFAYQALVGRRASALNPTVGQRTDTLDFINQKFTESGSVFGVLQDRQARHTPGSGLHSGDTNPLRLFALGGNIEGLTLFSPKEARVIAGNDIGDIAFYFQNVSSLDSSLVSAGRDLILYNASTPTRLFADEILAASGNRLLPLAGDVQIAGSGTVEILAGRNIDLGLGTENADGTGSGITSIGNRRNPYLAAEGADIIIGAGLSNGINPATSLDGSSLKWSAFFDDFVASDDGRTYLDRIVPGVDFTSLTEDQRIHLALEIFYLVLRDAGRDFNNPNSPDFRSYSAGMAAIESLFGEGSWGGEISTQSRSIRTSSGGDISIFAPGGGLALANTAPAGTTGENAPPPGIITESGGNISIFTDQSVDIGIGRIFTLRGGDATIWSSKGDIAAGSSSRTVASAPPTRVIIDPQSAAVQTDLAGLATGGGIGVLATVKGVDPGDVDLIAPTGSIDAGDAGIRVSGNINLAGVTIVNAGNISAGGSSTGAPAASVATPSVTSASNAAAAASSTASNQVAANQQQIAQTPVVDEQLSIITAEVIGYGGGNSEDEEEEKP